MDQKINNTQFLTICAFILFGILIYGIFVDLERNKTTIKELEAQISTLSEELQTLEYEGSLDRESILENSNTIDYILNDF